MLFRSAVALAVQALLAKQVQRIILTRPAVEAGERLGFLPGDMLAKVDPYLRPLYDALYDMLEPEAVGRFMEKGVIEVAPLAYMRGRTLNDSFIILDEAQNTTAEQMKMFLTRLGFGSKIVVTGDATQIDLPAPQASGAPPQAQPSSATSATTAASPPAATQRYASVEIVAACPLGGMAGGPGNHQDPAPHPDWESEIAGSEGCEVGFAEQGGVLDGAGEQCPGCDFGSLDVTAQAGGPFPRVQIGRSRDDRGGLVLAPPLLQLG